VCSEHLGFNSREARIEGLENGKTYQFVVVAYDKAGNFVASEGVMATPVPTNGLWDQCEAQGNICGEGWNCNVSEVEGGVIGALGLLGLFGLGGLVRSHRRRRACA
jgi:hypothetical protein